MLEPVSTFLGGKAVDAALSVFGEAVVARWTRHRAEQFIQRLLLELEANLDGASGPQAAAKMLQALVQDPEKSSALFDAYRAVALSKSRSLGPRIVAVVMAQALLSRGNVKLDRARVIEAATALDDDELCKVRDYLARDLRTAMGRELLQPGEEPGIKLLHLRMEGHTEQLRLERSTYSDRGTQVGHTPMSYMFGSWGVRLSTLGLITEEIEEKVSGRFPGGYSDFEDEPPVRCLTWFVTYESECIALAQFVQWLTAHESTV